MKRILFCLAMWSILSCGPEQKPLLTLLPNIPLTDPATCITPNLQTSPNGIVYMSYQQRFDDSVQLVLSQFKDDTWMPSKIIASGNTWFVNWADYPGITIFDAENMLAWYMEKSDTGTFTYDIKITTTNDSGNSWQPGKILHTDGVHAEHGFVSCVREGKGYFITWLDGRNTAAGEGEHAGHGHNGNMTLRCARLDLAGNTLEEWEADNKVCDCCHTATAITPEGPVVIYRNRNDDEIRDNYVLRLQGKVWAPPVSLHEQQWQTDACPINGPRLDAIGKQLAVVYFGAPAMQPSVHVKFSKDAGSHFGKPIRLDAGKPIGRVDIVWLNEEYAATSWLEDGFLWLTLLHANGEKLQTLQVAKISNGRSTGFPQLVKCGNTILAAITNTETNTIDTYRIAY